MSKFLLTATAPTNNIISESDLPFLMVSAENLVTVPDTTTDRPSDNHILIADQDSTGVWFTSWMLTSEYNKILETQSHATLIKQLRNKLLAASDWTQSKDIPVEVSSKWTEYRQALRDITSQEGFPTDIVWPVKPN